MSAVGRGFALALVGAAIGFATAAEAGTQLFEGSWTVKAFGNERTSGTGTSAIYSAFALPQGIQCNPYQPRCPFASTPTDGAGNFSRLGGRLTFALYCAPYTLFGSVRPTGKQYGTASPPTHFVSTAPLYRNPGFFTPNGQPRTTVCTATSRTPSGGKGLVQAGNPITGDWAATTTGTQRGGFNFAAAPPVGAGGIRTTGQLGEFRASLPYLYSYTYATLRNHHGVFGPGSGPGDFSIVYKVGASPVATVRVTRGAAKFGGVMQMLGALTTKACYFRNGGCSLGRNNFRYDAVGATAVGTYSMGEYVVTAGYLATYSAYYYHTALMQVSTIRVRGSRFPWTTGSATVRATGRGPHRTVHYAHGYDNRNTTTPVGKGVIQMVSPTLTRWLQPGASFETAGIGILRIRFVPEAQSWLMWTAGVALLGLGARLRAR